jgi:hypothetical protein
VKYREKEENGRKEHQVEEYDGRKKEKKKKVKKKNK